MALNEHIATLTAAISESMVNGNLLKLTLSNKRSKSDDLNNVFVKPVVIRDQTLLSFVYRHTTRDVTKNFTLEDAVDQIAGLLSATFFNADLFTSAADYSLLSNKRGRTTLLKKPASSAELPVFSHDKIKRRLIEAENNVYLRELGVLTADWKVRTDMQDKFRQINRYVELVEDVLKSAALPEGFTVADMGSGKGYLTFALYDHLKKSLNHSFHMIGIELRPALTDTCNRIAALAGFGTLRFETGAIVDAKLPPVNVLIALHACDTATDEAIYRGIVAGSEVIMVAPCCHKQIRKQISPSKPLSEITRFGILEERQAEMLTDTIRAMILEAYGYKTRVFEFIATEHTPKNVMIAAVRKEDRTSPDQLVLKRLDALKTMFGIKTHHLETLLKFGIQPSD
ncbi:MAG: sam-dependent methyltransferase [Bacteroidetes bacterium]|nr:MAG: sam-dependent methyltransferase [Bacteroidota bacterium]